MKTYERVLKWEFDAGKLLTGQNSTKVSMRRVQSAETHPYLNWDMGSVSLLPLPLPILYIPARMATMGEEEGTLLL